MLLTQGVGRCGPARKRARHKSWPHWALRIEIPKWRKPLGRRKLAMRPHLGGAGFRTSEVHPGSTPWRSGVRQAAFRLALMTAFADAAVLGWRAITLATDPRGADRARPRRKRKCKGAKARQESLLFARKLCSPNA